jgi:hypothetical protein
MAPTYTNVYNIRDVDSNLVYFVGAGSNSTNVYNTINNVATDSAVDPVMSNMVFDTLATAVLAADDRAAFGSNAVGRAGLSSQGGSNAIEHATLFASNVTVRGHLDALGDVRARSNVVVDGNETIGGDLAILAGSAVIQGTGQWLATDAGLGFGWSADPGTGLVRAAPSNVGLSVAGFGEVLRVNGAGFVGVGAAGIAASNAQYPLHVFSGDVEAVAIHTEGAISAMGDITALSDATVKTGVRRIEGALDRVSRINGYTFAWDPKVSPGLRRHAGVLAQEVQRVLPEVVTHDDATGLLSVSYGNMVALLIEAIKELSAKVDRCI